ncbi:MAG: energy-coupling factor transporter transmembrane component T, partial [Thermofilum sp.]
GLRRMSTLLEELSGVRLGASPYMSLHSVTRVTVPFLLSLSILFVRDVPSVLLVLLASALLLAAARIPLGVVRVYLLLLTSVTIFIAMAFMLFTRIPGQVLWKVEILKVQAERGVWEWAIVVTDASLERTAFYALRIVSMILTATLFISTVSDADILWGLRRLGLPAGFTVAAALFFRGVGFFFMDFAVVKEAMEARGVDFKRTSLAKRFILYVNALIPLLSLLITRSFEISSALETRGITPSTRMVRGYRLAPMRRRDYLALGLALVFVAGLAWWSACRL